MSSYLYYANSVIICLVFYFYFIKTNSYSCYFSSIFIFVFYRFCLFKDKSFSNTDIFSLYAEMIELRFFMASTCIEEIFMSGKISSDCCLDVELSSSRDTSVTSCYNAFVVFVLYYCQSDFSFSLVFCVF